MATSSSPRADETSRLHGQSPSLSRPLRQLIAFTSLKKPLPPDDEEPNLDQQNQEGIGSLNKTKSCLKSYRTLFQKAPPKRDEERNIQFKMEETEVFRYVKESKESDRRSRAKKTKSRASQIERIDLALSTFQSMELEKAQKKREESCQLI